MRDATPRIRSVVDVSEVFPGATSLIGAVVLIDAQLAKERPKADFNHRPVLVRYASADAASQATRDDSPASIEVRGRDVLYLPAHFPAKAADDYRDAMYVGLE